MELFNAQKYNKNETQSTRKSVQLLK